MFLYARGREREPSFLSHQSCPAFCTVNLLYLYVCCGSSCDLLGNPDPNIAPGVQRAMVLRQGYQYVSNCRITVITSIPGSGSRLCQL